VSDIDYKLVDGIIDSYKGAPSSVIDILREVQEHYRYLPRAVFHRLSEKVGLSEARVFSVATFYENFSLEPKGRNIIKVCDGTACHVRKSMPILERLKQELGLAPGGVTTKDLQFSLEPKFPSKLA
jgi:NADH-quinone oxidoreductase subunit E